MSLLDIPLKLKYRSDVDKLYEDFYDKCLTESVAYDRAVGYFTSNCLQLIAKGLEHFLHKGGKVRLIANPFLEKADLEAIIKGYEARENIIERCLLKQLEVTSKHIKDDTLNILAWLIYEGKLDIKIAFTKNQNGIYHEKFGLFKDAEQQVILFSGSANETYGGMANNFEKIDVFTPPRDAERIEEAIEDFESLWNDRTSGLIVKEINDEMKQFILNHKSAEKPLKRDVIVPKPSARPYQEKAIQAFFDNGAQGILEMATGTGKTITSLLTMERYRETYSRTFCIIFAPFKHLVDQWKEECKKFDIKDPLLCYGSSDSWKNILREKIFNYNIGISDFEVVITTYDSATNSKFYEEIQKIVQNSFLIADECHYMGSKKFRSLPYSNIDARLGLSATPNRWWDEVGTEFLQQYFNGVVYEYTLDEAIRAGKLTSYKYYPEVIHLLPNELEAYKKLTRRIIQLFNSPNKDDEQLSTLNRKRARILSKAYGKIPRLLEMLEEKGVENISHTIVYCAEGQVSEITHALSDLGIKVHKFDSTVPNKKRQQLLTRFANSEIQILVAIKCLDEGVDVPSTKVAYFLASTSNPREFVQRRGRILRTFKGKDIAEIYDFIVFPENVDADTFETVAKKELPRFAEFANSSLTPTLAKEVLTDYLNPYNLYYLMDMKPWDVYKAMKEEIDTND